MAKVNVMAQQEDKEQLANVFLFLVAIKSLVAFEFGSNVGQFFVDALHFIFFALTWKEFG